MTDRVLHMYFDFIVRVHISVSGHISKEVSMLLSINGFSTFAGVPVKLVNGQVYVHVGELVRGFHPIPAEVSEHSRQFVEIYPSRYIDGGLDLSPTLRIVERDGDPSITILFKEMTVKPFLLGGRLLTLGYTGEGNKKVYNALISLSEGDSVIASWNTLSILYRIEGGKPVVCWTSREGTL